MASIAQPDTPGPSAPCVAPATDAALPRITKRKLDEVISRLDDAVNPTEERPTPAKRVQTRPPSIYASLAKFGFRRTHSDLSDTASTTSSRPLSPAFSALLSRSRTRLSESDADTSSVASSPTSTRRRSGALSSILAKASSRSRFLKPRPKLPTFPSGSNSPDPLANASPSSLQAFLARLATFTRSAYSTQPTALNPAHAAACGWHCPPPSASISASVSGTPRSKGDGSASEKSNTPSGMDRLACAICKSTWTIASSRGLTRDAANALTERQAKMLIENHEALCPWRKHQCDLSIYRVPLKIPLQTARDVIAAAKGMDDAIRGIEVVHPLMPDQQKRALHILQQVPLTDAPEEEDITLDTRPCTSALLAALFGWELAPAPPPPPVRRASSTFGSWSRASSRTSSPAPSLARADALLHCTLCQRRVGLWTQRPLHVLREHRDYCPYVARTAGLPGSSGAVEGWRARVGVLLRYALGLRGRGRDPDGSGSGAGEQEDEENLERVHSMVRAVRDGTTGGGDVRKYVRGLLEPLKSATAA